MRSPDGTNVVLTRRDQRAGRSSLGLWLLALWMACALPACNALASLSPPSRDEGVLEVAAYYEVLGGQPTPTPTTPQPTPIPCLRPPPPMLIRVAVARPDHPTQVVAEQWTTCRAAFRLPAGRYWVFVPWLDQPVPGPRWAYAGTQLPDRTDAFDWKDVLVPAGGSVRTTLTIAEIGA